MSGGGWDWSWARTGWMDEIALWERGKEREVTWRVANGEVFPVTRPTGPGLGNRRERAGDGGALSQVLMLDRAEELVAEAMELGLLENDRAWQVRTARVIGWWAKQRTVGVSAEGGFERKGGKGGGKGVSSRQQVKAWQTWGERFVWRDTDSVGRAVKPRVDLCAWEVPLDIQGALVELRDEVAGLEERIRVYRSMNHRGTVTAPGSGGDWECGGELGCGAVSADEDLFREVGCGSGE